jgi:NADH-quinone oxidoreductase subunit M
MGTYGFLRFNLPLFPSASKTFIPLIIVLAVIGIVYGALLAMAQKDMKKLIAYSSVSHLGFAMAGIFAMNHQGLSGGILQMINHGVSTGGLFLLVGMIYERRHTRMMADLGGLAKQLPVYATFTLLIILASIGFPGTNGFVSEFLILLGLFKIHWVVGALAALGITLGVVYMLWMYKRIMLGKLDKPENKELKDLSLREIVTLLPIIFFIFWIGLYPKPFLNSIEASTTHLLEIIQRNDVKAHIAESNNHSTQQLNEELVKSVRRENHE